MEDCWEFPVLLVVAYNQVDCNKTSAHCCHSISKQFKDPVFVHRKIGHVGISKIKNSTKFLISTSLIILRFLAVLSYKSLSPFSHCLGEEIFV